MTERRNIMRRFKISELSAVDNPAQKHARMAIMKRADDATNPGGSGDRAKEANMTDLEKIANLESQIADLNKKLTTAETSIAAITKARDDALTAAGDLQKSVELAKSDEVITVAGQEVRKSVVGEGSFAVFKAQQAEIVKVRDEAETSRLEKRADDEFGVLPGTTAERAAVLKYIASAPDEVRKTAEAILTAAQKTMVSAFNTVGNRGEKPAVSKGGGSFMVKVNEIAKRDGLGKADAMTKARRECPDEYEAYQGAN